MTKTSDTTQDPITNHTRDAVLRNTWKGMDPKDWINSVNSTKHCTFFDGFFNDSYKQLLRLCEGMDSVLDVGCGPGTFLDRVSKAFPTKHFTGIDFNAKFIEHANAQFKSDNCHFIVGNVMELSADTVKGRQMIMCNGNTNGIFPANDRLKIWTQMWQCLGPGGRCVQAVWDANSFGDGLQHYYSKNMQLCGSLEGADIDWLNTTLRTKSGYTSHWTSREELESLAKSAGWENVNIISIENGLVIVADKM